MKFKRKIIPATVAGEAIHFREPTLAELQAVDMLPERDKLTALVMLAVCEPSGSPSFVSAEAVADIPVTVLREIATKFQTSVHEKKD